MTTLQLDIFSSTLERVVVEPTPDVIYRGASAAGVPVHEHVPAPRPNAAADDDDWLLILAGAEEQIRWWSWTRPHPIPLDDHPDSTGGRSAAGRWVDYGAKGVSIHPFGEPAMYVPWPRLLKGLHEQREHEPHIADARDLAHAYHALEQYDRFYVRDGGSVRDGGDRDGWRETVAVPHLEKLKGIVTELGGDPDAVLSKPPSTHQIDGVVG